MRISFKIQNFQKTSRISDVQKTRIIFQLRENSKLLISFSIADSAIRHQPTRMQFVASGGQMELD